MDQNKNEPINNLQRNEKNGKRKYNVYRLLILAEVIIGMIFFVLTVRALYYRIVINDFVQKHFDGSKESFMVGRPAHAEMIFILYIATVILFLMADFSRRRIKKRLSIL